MITGIVPKMAIRFTSYEYYKQILANKSTGTVSGQATFFGESPSNLSFNSSCHAQQPLHSFPQTPTKMLITKLSRTRRWRHRSRCGCHTDGGDQNPTPSPTSLHGRSARYPQIPQRRTRPLHSRQGRRAGRTLPRRVPDRLAPGHEPGREFHCL